MAVVIAAGAETIDLADETLVGNAYTVTSLSDSTSYTNSGEDTIDLVVNLSAAVTYSGSISGNIRLVKKGNGTLTLPNANSFTRGTSIEAGQIAIGHIDALGDGDIYMKRNSTSPYASLVINVSGTMDNNFLFDTSYVSEMGYSEFKITVNDTVTFSGDFSGGSYTIRSAANKHVYFTGAINSSGYVYFYPKTVNYYMYLQGSLNVNTLGSWSSGNPFGYILLDMANPGSVSTMLAKYVELRFNRPNLAPGSVWKFASNEESRSIFDLRGNDQTIDRVVYNSGAKVWGGNAHRVRSTGTTKARLTMRATKSCESDVRFENNITVVWWPEDDYTFTLISNRTWTTTGDLIVSNGTFNLATGSIASMKRIEIAPGATLSIGTDVTGALGSVTNVSVGAGGSLVWETSANVPFTDYIVYLDVASDASVSLPLGCILNVAEYRVGGVRQAGGTYAAGSGSIFVPAAETAEISWTGAGSGDLASIVDNWSEVPNLVDGSLLATFAASGSSSTRAVFDTPAFMQGIVFSQPSGFSVAAANGAAISLLSGGVSAEALEGATPTYELAVPMQIEASQAWTFPADGSVTFTMAAPLRSAEDSARYMLAVTNVAGTVNMFTTNSTYVGNVIVNARKMRIRGEGAFGPATKGGTARLYTNANTYPDAKCLFDGCTIDKPLDATTLIGSSNYPVFDTVDGSTNVFNGKVDLAYWSGFGKNSVTIFNGKVAIKEYTRQIVRGNSRLYFKGGVEFGGYYGSRTMDTSPTVSDNYFVFESPVTYDRPAIDTVNGFPIVLHNYTVFDMRVDYAFTSGYWNNSGKVELNGHPQRITKWTGSGTISSTNDVVSLEYNPPAGLVCTNSNKFVGFAGLKMVGGGTVVMKGVSTSEGELAATNGVMELVGNASWANCSKVSVSDAGQIRVGHSAALPSRYTAYNLEDEGARLFLADGVSLETYELRIDGKKQGPGIYGARAALSEWFDASGGGSIRVLSAGTRVILK